MTQPATFPTNADTSFQYGANAQPPTQDGTPRLNADAAKALLTQWYEAQQQLEAAKDREAELRKQIGESMLWDHHKVKGVQRHPLGNGYNLKLDKRENVSVANKEHEAAQAVAQLRTLGAVEADRANRLFSFSARLSETVYKELTDAEKAIVDPIITRKPAAPSLKLEEPKSKK